MAGICFFFFENMLEHVFRYEEEKWLLHVAWPHCCTDTNKCLIAVQDDPLALTGPRIALGGLDRTFFQFHLKIKGEGAVDKDFSKGLIEWNGTFFK